jgi:hypothetical protein
MKIIDILKTDYQRFPLNQTYNIYAEDVYFQDPLNKFIGIKRYQKMIKFLDTFFKNIKMELHNIEQENDVIYSKWTLYLTSPLPWQPAIAISGTSELKLNSDNLIISHIDYWDCSIFDVIKQNFRLRKTN